MTFDVWSNCIHLRFWIRILTRAQINMSYEMLEIVRNRLLQITCYRISWCQISSLVIPNADASLPASPRWFLTSSMSHYFWVVSGVAMEESASHLLSLCERARLIVQFGGLEERAESKMLKCEGSCCVLLPIAYNNRLFAVVYIYFYIININIGRQVKRHTSKVKKYCFNLYNYSS